MTPGERTTQFQPMKWNEDKSGLVADGDAYDRAVTCGCHRTEPSTRGYGPELWWRVECPNLPDVAWEQPHASEYSKWTRTTYLCWACAFKHAGPEYWFFKGLKELAEEGKPPIIEW